MNKRLVTAMRHCASGLLIASATLPLQAALAANPDILVTKFTDSLDGSCNSDCSLREAVQLANQTPGTSRIVLAAGTYLLSIAPIYNDVASENPLVDDDDNLNGDLDIKGRLTIVGRGIDVTTIDAGRIDRIAEVLPGAVATLSKLTVRNGREPFRGGGLDVNADGTLTLSSCAVSNSFASAAFVAGHGGGIWNGGTLNVDGSRIDGNSSLAGEGFFGSGGGIYNQGNLTMRDSRVIDNRSFDDDDRGLGGGIYNSGTADIRRSSFENNRVSAIGSGAAILNTGIGQLRLENSTFTGSTKDGAGGESVPSAAVENGYSFDGPTMSARLVNVTIAGNGIYGLTNRGRLSIANSIITGNGPVEDPDTGVDGFDQNCLNVGTGAQFSQVGLLRGTDTGNCAATLLVLNADSFVTVLHTLAMNNGQSPTFALRKGSVAVDAAIGACPFTDQRRVIRLRDGNGDGIIACDLGSYERTKP